MTTLVDHWDLVRSFLAVALVGCNVGVWYGVKLENSSNQVDIERGKSILVRSLALEALFAAILFAVDTKSSLDQKQQIAVLYDRATKAELELAKIESPRSINAAAKGRIGEKLRVYSGTPFDMAISPAAEMEFMVDVRESVILAEWVWLRAGGSDAMSLDALRVRDKEPHAEVVGAFRGVQIMYDAGNSQLKAPAEALAKALGEEGIKAVKATARSFATFASPMRTDAIHIQIGNRL